jgi:DNA-binding beta-propeller fold protein YncE
MNRAWLVTASLVVLFTACTSVGKIPKPVNTNENIVWPTPPQKARIEFLYDFREPKDLGLTQSFFARLWDYVAGEQENAMVRPYALAVNGDRIAVADPGARAVHIFDREKNKYQQITRVNEEPLVSPVGISIGPERLYISDSYLKKVFILDYQGNFISVIEGMSRPTGLSFEPDSERLYVADTLAHRISVFDADGKKLFDFGGRGGKKQGDFNSPTHLYLASGKLYVNDTMNFRIQIFDLNGNYLSTFGTQGDGSGYFSQPKGIGTDTEGNIYVVDAIFHRVQIFNPQGRFLLDFGSRGRKKGEFWLPAGLNIVQDKIYVADSYNRRVQVFRFLGGS